MTTVDVAAHLRTMRAQVPLVQCITNTVVQQFSANVLLAAGAFARDAGPRGGRRPVRPHRERHPRELRHRDQPPAARRRCRDRSRRRIGHRSVLHRVLRRCRPPHPAHPPPRLVPPPHLHPRQRLGDRGAGRRRRGRKCRASNPQNEVDAVLDHAGCLSLLTPARSSPHPGPRDAIIDSHPDDPDSSCSPASQAAPTSCRSSWAPAARWPHSLRPTWRPPRTAGPGPLRRRRDRPRALSCPSLRRRRRALPRPPAPSPSPSLTPAYGVGDDLTAVDVDGRDRWKGHTDDHSRPRRHDRCRCHRHPDQPHPRTARGCSFPTTGSLYLVTDTEQRAAAGRTVLQTAAEAVAGGVGIVQICREHASDAEVAALTRDTISVIEAAGRSITPTTQAPAPTPAAPSSVPSPCSSTTGSRS